jgi:hypothetical protein
METAALLGAMVAALYLFWPCKKRSATPAIKTLEPTERPQAATEAKDEL